MSDQKQSPSTVNQPENDQTLKNTPKLDIEVYLQLVNMVTKFLNENKGFHQKPDIHKIGIFIADLLHMLEEKIRGEITEKVRAEITEQIKFQLGDQLEEGKMGNVQPKQKEPQKKSIKYVPVPIPNPVKIPKSTVKPIHKVVYPRKQIYWGTNNDWIYDNDDTVWGTKIKMIKKNMEQSAKEYRKNRKYIKDETVNFNQLLAYSLHTKQFKLNSKVVS